MKSANPAKSCWNNLRIPWVLQLSETSVFGTNYYLFFLDKISQNMRCYKWCSKHYVLRDGVHHCFARTLKANLEMPGSSLCPEKQLWSPHTIRCPVESMQERLKRKQNFLKSLSGSLDGEAFKFRIPTWLGISVCLMLSYLVQQLGHEILWFLLTLREVEFCCPSCGSLDVKC